MSMWEAKGSRGGERGEWGIEQGTGREEEGEQEDKREGEADLIVKTRSKKLSG